MDADSQLKETLKIALNNAVSRMEQLKDPSDRRCLFHEYKEWLGEDIKDEDLIRLDNYEGVKENHYKRKNFQVSDLNGHLISAVAYVAIKTGPESRPTKEYLNYLLEGEHLLSPEYISKLEGLLNEHLKLGVTIKGSSKRGRITLKYRSESELEGLLRLFQSS